MTGDALWNALLSEENLRLAWLRCRWDFASSNHFVDYEAVGSFGLDLVANLAGVRAEMASGRYAPAPLQRAFLMKANGGPRSLPTMRRSWWPAMRDQVAWMAVANVIGPAIDRQIPTWVYADRLRSSFEAAPDPDDCRLYRPIAEAWPLLQRHVHLTARLMRDGRMTADALPPVEAALWAREQSEAAPIRLRYWATGWTPAPVHALSLDFKSFSRHVRIRHIRDGLENYCPAYRNDARLRRLIDDMLMFSEVDGTVIDEIPVGSVVRGLLSNIAMLPVDKEIDTWLDVRPVAHFRSVDDHVMLASNSVELGLWQADYRALMAQRFDGIEIVPYKVRPDAARRFLTEPHREPEQCFPDTPFDPDAPESLWSLMPFGLPQDAHLSVRSPFGSADVAAVQIPEEDVVPWYAGVFARRRAMMAALRDRRGLLRGTLILLARTGLQGMALLRRDFEALSASVPEAGAAGIALLAQFTAPILYASAQRAADPAQPARARAIAYAFLCDCGELAGLPATAAGSWSYHRSLANLRIAATAAANVLEAVGAPQEPRTALRSLGSADARALARWHAWFEDFSECASTTGARAA